MKKEVTINSRGQCNLSGVRTQSHRFYLAEENAEGVITLIPAALVPARLLSRPTPGGNVIERTELFPSWLEEG